MYYVAVASRANPETGIMIQVHDAESLTEAFCIMNRESEGPDHGPDPAIVGAFAFAFDLFNGCRMIIGYEGQISNAEKDKVDVHYTCGSQIWQALRDHLTAKETVDARPF